MLASGLFEHRFFGWLNDKIDEHGSVAVKEAFETVTEVARNPLGITGIIAILVLVVAFGHSYIFVAFGRNAGGRLFWQSLLLGWRSCGPYRLDTNRLPASSGRL